MNILLRLLTLFIVFTAQRVKAQEVLTNQSIVSMQQARLSRNLITDKIRTSRNRFDLSTIGLLSLKTESIPDALIEAMMPVTAHSDVLHNDDIINLCSGGLSRSVITRKIQATKTDFDLSSTGLIQLKMAKVPEAIVKLMMSPSPTVSASAPVTTSPTKSLFRPTPPTREAESAPAVSVRPTDLPLPTLASFPEPGIFYEEYQTRGEYLQLEPTTTNMAKSGSLGEAILGSYTNGISGSTQRVGLANKTSNFIIDDVRPVFYFRFSDTRKQMDDVAENFWSGVSSPNEFVLIKASTSGRGRQITIGRSSGYTSERGVTGNTIPFRFKKIATGLYRVYFEQNVPAGEYVFFYNKGSEQSSSIKVYDFSQRSKAR